MQMIAYVVVVLLLLVAYRSVAAVASFARSYTLLRHLPGPSGNVLFGNVKEFLQNQRPHENLLAWRKSFGPLFRMRLLNQMWVIVADPQLAVVALKGNNAVEKAVHVLKFVDSIANSQPALFSSATNSYWKAVRKSVAKSFSSDALRKQFQHVQHCLSRLLTVIENSNGLAMDMNDLSLCLTIEVIGRTGFDYQISCLEPSGAASTPCHTTSAAAASQKNFMHKLKLALEEVGKMCFDPMRRMEFWDPTLATGQRAIKDVSSYVKELTQLFLSRGAPAEDDVSLLAQLLRVIDPNTGKPLTPAQLQAEITTLLMAGFDTTGHSVAYTMLCIAKHPHVEQKLLQELDAFGLLATESNPKPPLPTYDQISKLVYVNAVMKECMRMMPVIAPGVWRWAKEDFQLGTTVVPKGTMLLLNAYSMHLDNGMWRDAEGFNPDRWLSESTEGSGAGVMAYAPFGVGTRDCVGQNLAKLEIVAALAALYGRFSFKLAEGWTYERVRKEEVVTFLLHPREGIRMHASPRVAVKQ